MRILLLNGSPRKGSNTSCLLNRMKETLSAAHDVEIAEVCSMDIKGCTACDACKKNGGHCVFNDGSDEVIEKIAQADAVVFGTPVYWWGMSSQLKAVLDKFYSRSQQFMAMKGKKLAVVMTGGAGIEEIQYKLIGKQFECIAEYLNWKLAFTAAFSAYEAGDVLKQKDTEKKIQEACSSISK